MRPTSRRRFIAQGASLTGLLAWGTPHAAPSTTVGDARFVFIIQRGAADGLGTIGAVGDPAFAGARGQLAADFASAKKLDSMFALHPAMTSLAGMYDAKEALFAHAIASPYRDRETG